jgi:hypothetical protein
MPADKSSDPAIESRRTDGLFGRVFGRYRVFVDAWPIVTTILLLSGALGIEAHFFMLGVNASEVLTLEEFTIYAVLGLVIALAVATVGCSISAACCSFAARGCSREPRAWVAEPNSFTPMSARIRS